MKPERAVVFAQATTSITYGGAPYMIKAGTHWPADDRVVIDNPDLFTDDPRPGLHFTDEPSWLYDGPEAA